MIAPWAKDEVETADLGDERLNGRFQLLLSALGARPNLSIPAACGGRAEMEAAYRFFDNDKVTFDKVLGPHIARTRQRLAGQEVVLLVQDTSEVDLTRPRQEVAGAGDLDGSRRGFLLHEMQAFTPAGTPLGTVWAEILNRTGGVSHAPARQKEHGKKHTPIEEKESLRWLTGLRQANAVAEQAPHVQCVGMADSEADIYELFAEPRGAAHWLIRACQDRALREAGAEAGAEAEAEAEAEAGRHLRERVLAAPVLYQVELLVRGRQAKTAVEKRRRRQNRETRRATVEVRAAAVTLRPPWRFDRQLPEVTVNVVLAREPDPPAGAEPVEWVLVTTLPITAPEQVRQVVQYYCVRWGIELFFRTLKSGCRIERRRFEDVERVLPCLALCLIVAWRTMSVCHLSRECPDADCECLFEPSEWKAVWVTIHKKPPPKKAPRLCTMIRLIAGLGGYVERPKSEPGVQTVWIGMQRMYDLAWAWDSFGPGARAAVDLCGTTRAGALGY